MMWQSELRPLQAIMEFIVHRLCVDLNVVVV